MLQIETLQPSDIPAYLDQLAKLRITVFREFPYLYEGDTAYEAKYLQTYVEARDAIVILAKHENKVVGAATGLPLDQEEDAFIKPICDAGYNPDTIFYFGESVLLPEYRGQGTGSIFIEQREQHARSLNRFQYTAFCSVDRPDDHPAKPPHYKPLHGFWKRHGYRPLPEVKVYFPWRDIGEEDETSKPMTVWIKSL